MLKGLLVLHDSGTPVYTYLTGDQGVGKEVLLSGFVAAIQSFAGEMLTSPGSRNASNIQSIKLAQSLLLTFRLLNLQSTKGQPLRYYFVLLSDVGQKGPVETEPLLEYLILNFLSYNGGDFRRKLRATSIRSDEFDSFNQFLARIIDLDWDSIRKKVKPIPGSLVQGLLNEIRSYIPLDQILRLHPRIVRLGSSYAWLSDDLPEAEERELLAKIEQTLSRLFGKALYGSLVTDVTKQLRTQQVPPG